jgi:hypothetical protein
MLLRLFGLEYQLVLISMWMTYNKIGLTESCLSTHKTSEQTNENIKPHHGALLPAENLLWNEAETAIFRKMEAPGVEE